MADEGSFHQAILANPADDLPRLVYADWLDEQGTEEATRKAEFLRVTAALVMETNNDTRLKLERRQAELARCRPTGCRSSAGWPSRIVRRAERFRCRDWVERWKGSSSTSSARSNGRR